MHGRRRQDGSRMDRGTGLSNRSVIDGLRQAVEDGFLIEKRDLLVQDIIDTLGDTHSKRFYRLVAAKIPAEVIYQALSEIKGDGADDPRKVFTFRMNRY